MVGLSVGLINSVVFGGIFGAMGLFLVYYGWRLNQKPKVSNPGWTSAKGKVVSVHVNRIQDPVRFQVTFIPIIQYSYEANGQTYQADNQSTAAGDNSVNAQRVADRYPAGKTVNISYNPTDPRQSMIDVTTANGNFYLMAGAGLLVFAAILVCVIMGFSIFVGNMSSSF